MVIAKNLRCSKGRHSAPAYTECNRISYGKLGKYLTFISLIGKTSSYTKDSAQLVDKIVEVKLGPQDLMISFDVVSLCPIVPVMTIYDPSVRFFPRTLRHYFTIA